MHPNMSTDIAHTKVVGVHLYHTATDIRIKIQFTIPQLTNTVSQLGNSGVRAICKMIVSKIY